MERIKLIERHLSKLPSTEDHSLEEYRRRGMKVEAEYLHPVIDGPYWKTIRELLIPFKDVLDPRALIEMPTEDQRAYFFDSLRRLIESGKLTQDLDEYDSSLSKIVMTIIGQFDNALCTRLLVHIFLYADSIRALGTDKHNEAIARAYSFKDYGSFGLTELGHGSNADGVELTATYIKETREFELNSPTPTSAKWWIGAVGKTANMSTVFAQLYVGGESQGVHVFLIPIRDLDTHEPFKGVVCGDCGPKGGSDAIDNGFLLFENYRVPYDSLLDRLGQVTQDGKYRSKIKSKKKRFSAMLAGLARGRISLLSGVGVLLRHALAAAIRYGAVRKQFGTPERPVLDYQLHRVRLSIHLAKAFAIGLASELACSLHSRYRDIIRDDPLSNESDEMHCILSAFKPICTWWAMKGIQECREACGGQGYSAYSMFGRWRACCDVNLTWEGDNNVLLQQAARFVLKVAQRVLQGKRINTPYLAYLNMDSSVVYSLKAGDVTISSLKENLLFPLACLEYRVNLMLHKTIARMTDSMQSRDSTDAWNHSQVFYLAELAKSFGEAVILQQFYEAVQRTAAKSPLNGYALSRLMQLYAFSIINDNLILFREREFFTATQGNMITDLVIELSEEIGNSAVNIIDAISLDDQTSGSVLGRRDGQVYKHIIEAVESQPDCYEKPSWISQVRSLRRQ